jgi:hypothetical protein
MVDASSGAQVKTRINPEGRRGTEGRKWKIKAAKTVTQGIEVCTAAALLPFLLLRQL